MRHKRHIGVILKNLSDPIWIRDKFLFKFFFPLLTVMNGHVNVFKKRWKYMLILDACRYDFFSEIINEVYLNGKLSCIYSAGSSTPFFLLNNLKEVKNELKDVIYISANPMVDSVLDSYNLSKKFYKTIGLWKIIWNEKYATVLPDEFIEHSLRIIKNFPEKRFVLHFMQPHFPFISDPSIGRYDSLLAKYSAEGLDMFPKKRRHYNPFIISPCDFYIETGTTRLKQLYKENLRIVLQSIKETFLPNIDTRNGKVVITSDHGEMFGERILMFKIYGHPYNARIKTLIKVPWFEII